MATVQHDCVAARDHYEVALMHVRKTGDRPGIAKVLNCLAVAATYAGDFQQARGMLEEALGIFRDLKTPYNIAAVLTNLGETALSMDDDDAARAYLEQSIAAVDDRGQKNREILGLALRGLSLVDFRQNRFEEARANAREALGLFASGATFVSVPEALSQVAIVDAAFGEWERVARLLGASKALGISQGIPFANKPTGERAEAEVGAIRALGAAGFRAEYDLGLKMSMEQAIEYALAR
jgi:tetratricopeptide (TPR) repeat protein